MYYLIGFGILALIYGIFAYRAMVNDDKFIDEMCDQAREQSKKEEQLPTFRNEEMK